MIQVQDPISALLDKQVAYSCVGNHPKTQPSAIGNNVFLVGSYEWIYSSDF